MCATNIHQQAVDKLANSALKLTVEEFLSIGDYGNENVIVDGQQISVGWWHWKFDEELHHLVYIADQKVVLGLIQKAYKWSQTTGQQHFSSYPKRNR